MGMKASRLLLLSKSRSEYIFDRIDGSFHYVIQVRSRDCNRCRFIKEQLGLQMCAYKVMSSLSIYSIIFISTDVLLCHPVSSITEKEQW
ncbi:hypothetical protein SAMN03080594_103327 [Arenibacter palladensis]|uniref:Uncharacterized protein n=1 Tax=Arenibacter palladensis TaxID=237373 RepID=A0A1M5ANJ1_9FLAO|nr:hypothetical protein SAMN03080594_103327 [Arenibacter palladensis]